MIYNFIEETCAGVPALDQHSILESAVQIYIGKEAIKVS
jgi:hypothetical protein